MNLNRTKFYITTILLSIVICQIFAEIEPREESYQTEKNQINSIDTVKHEVGDSALPIPNEVPDGGGNTKEPSKSFTAPDIGFLHAFVASLSVIVVSELGDKTFFIAAIMAMRHPRLTVFGGAIGALALMTVLSAVFGMAATIIPRVYTYYISTALFAIFGLKMLYEGYHMSPNEGQEELEEVQMDIRKREDEKKKDEDILKKENDSDDNLNNNDEEIKKSSTSLTTSVHLSNNNKTTIPNGSLKLSKHSLNDKLNNNNTLDENGNTDNKDDLDEESHQREALLKNGINGNIRHSSSVDILYSTKNKTRRSSGDCDTVIQSADSNMDLKQLNKKNNKRLEKEASAMVITTDPESGVVKKQKRNIGWYLTSRILMQSFTMTFLAEWGDRSQLTTIILSARENVYGVIVGGVLGHSLCTGVAVLGGRMIAQKISVRTVTIIGGIVFLVFALSALFISPDAEFPTPNV